MELSDRTRFPRRAAQIDPHLRFAVREMTLDMFAAEEIKSYNQMRDELVALGLADRVTAANLQKNHGVPKYVQDLIEDFPTGVENGCPAMLLHFEDHLASNANRPNSFHTILYQLIPKRNTRRFQELFPGQTHITRQQAKAGLREAYRRWISQNGLDDPDVDHVDNIMRALDAWIDNPTP
jgi:hypothetical protein